MLLTRSLLLLCIPAISSVVPVSWDSPLGGAGLMGEQPVHRYRADAQEGLHWV
jgi:hypothetical protein